jgi:hypothetical protein
MTKIAVIVSSAIDVDGPSFSYAPESPRTFFTPEERFRQTIGTIVNLSSKFPHATIFVVESGAPNEEHKQNFKKLFENVEYVAIKDLDADLYERVRNHKNKSFCESASVLCFMEHYKTRLKEFDFVMKVSGRYLFDFGKTVELEENKIYFKHFKFFKWKPLWDEFFKIVDNREEDGDQLGYACSAVYCFHINYLEEMMGVLTMVKHITNTTKYNLDIESCLYYLTRHYKNDIINVDWRLIGFYGNMGKLVHW